jgi:hypothetical protein
MKIIRGSGAGLDDLTPHQYSNDWISYNGGPRGGGITGPLRVELTAADIAWFNERRAEDTDQGSLRFWNAYDLTDDGRFIARSS